jgi:putative oxidoreductase
MTLKRSFTGDLALLAGRAVLGSYLAAHGAQKLFGSFGGPGIDKAAAGFHQIGLRPGDVMARLASVSELGGGLLTLAGAAHPVGPVAIAGTMAVASTTHRANGPFAGNRGYELALTNLAGALVLAVTGPGRFSVDGLRGARLPKWVTAAAVLGGAVMSAASIRMLLKFEPEPAPQESADTAPTTSD